MMQLIKKHNSVPDNGGLSLGMLAPRSDWKEMRDCEHFVQFYETDEFLINSLSGFIGAGLDESDACIVVATKGHRDGLEEQLRASGLDVAAAAARGQYVSLDASETLSRIMFEGSPDHGLFSEVLGSSIARAAEGRRQVRIFGEMVALLWAEGNHTATLRLEELWNDLRKTHPFLLFCAYPMNGFGGVGLVEPLGEVCAGHSRVIPAESYAAVANPDERLRAIILLQQKARSLEGEIAERKKAEEQLRRKEQELRDFIENAALALHWVGPDGTILWANRAELDLLGYPREEYIGHHIAEFHVDQEVIEDILRKLTEKETLHNYEARLRCKNGSTKYVLISSNVYWENGEFIHTRCFTRDITERRQAEQEREQLLVQEQMARAEAESASRMKDEFLATVSHELRTPLNAIIGWSHMLSKGTLDEASALRALETIERNAKSQAQLIEDILDVSRVITGKLRLNIEPVDVASIINTAIDSVQLAADAKRIQLEVTIDPSIRQISGDSSRLRQVIWNVLSNAIKFTPSGGRVEVRLERVARDIQIKISDTGQGISRAFLPFIFDRFRQADATTTRRHAGLGLGLAIVQHLVELHGGTVFADSPGEDCGATFTIRIPRSGRRRPKGRRRVARTSGSNGSKGQFESLPSLDDVRVLLVDDDRDTVQVLTAMLREQRAKVQAAASAGEALEMLECWEPDVLVSDLAMPDEDGYSLIDKVRARETKNGKQTPAVALTAHVRVEDRARALSAGFDMFVPKPVEPKELIIAIANLAETSASKNGRQPVL